MYLAALELPALGWEMPGGGVNVWKLGRTGFGEKRDVSSL